MQLPEDIEAERTLLSTICARGADRMAAECCAVLRGGDFMHPGHRLLFEATRQLSSENVEITPHALLDRIGTESGKVGGFSGIIEILNGEEVNRPLVLAQILIDHRKRREIIRLGYQLIKDGQALLDPSDMAITAATALLGVQTEAGRRGLVDSKAGIQEVLDQLDSGLMPGTLTGFERLDECLQGFQPGQLIILGARPGVGKTVLALNWALSAVNHGPVFLFSLEMGKSELYLRMAANMASVPRKAIKNRTMTDWQDAAVRRALKQIEALPLMINDSANVTISEIQSQCRAAATRRGVPSLILVDHIGLVNHSAPGKNEATRLGEVSRACKMLAKEINAPVVALSQLNRKIEESDRKPQLSDLRDSGAIEQDADIVTFIHRKVKPYVEGQPVDKTGSLIISKHRDGECIEIPMIFEGGYCRYIEDSNPQPTQGFYREGL